MAPKTSETPDIFLWANQADAHKDELEVDLFLFTKGFTAYSTSYSNALKAQLKVLFLYDLISQVQVGAATGMTVLNSETYDGEDNTLEYVSLDSVAHAQEVLEQVIYDEQNLELFQEGTNELKKLRGIVARFTGAGIEPFYVVKHLPQSQILKGKVSWAFSDDGEFQPMPMAAAIKINPGNETLVVGNTVFVFNEPKFVKQFGYDVRTAALVANKIAAIEQQFKLKYPEGVTFQDLADHSAALTSKLLKVELGTVTQDNVIEQADKFDIALMTDDTTGQIILMDAKDAIKFVNLLNDDYVESGMTGVHYLAKSKKQVNPTEESQMGMGI